MITSPALIDALCYQQLSIISSLASSAAQHYKLKKLRWLETSGRWSFISDKVIDRKITWWDVFGQVISTYQWSIITSPALVDALNCQQLSIIGSSALSAAQLKKLRWLETSGRWSFILSKVIDRKITWSDVFDQIISSSQMFNYHQSSISGCPALSAAQHHRQVSIVTCSSKEAALVRNFGKMVFDIK